MAPERLKSPRARLFVALEIPETVRKRLAAWQERELTDPALRPVALSSLHITLCFIGWAPERRIPEYAEAISAIVPRAVPMRLDPEPVPLPRRRPRLYALDAPSDAAVELAAEVNAVLLDRSLYEPERREFWSHITVARVRGNQSPNKRTRAPGPLDAAARTPFEAVRLTFYRSNLSSHGSTYVALASTDLPPA